VNGICFPGYHCLIKGELRASAVFINGNDDCIVLNHSDGQQQENSERIKELLTSEQLNQEITNIRITTDQECLNIDSEIHFDCDANGMKISNAQGEI
jgi:hypothetical protein